MSRKGFRHSEETKQKLRLAHLGKPSGMLGKKRSLSNKEKISKTLMSHLISSQTREKISSTLLAKNNILFPFSIKANRRRAKQRDNYTCQICGINDPEILEVDHIIPKKIRPDLKSEIANLLTLCANCHKRKTNRDKKQIWAFKQQRKSLQEIESEYYQLK